MDAYAIHACGAQLHSTVQTVGQGVTVEMDSFLQVGGECMFLKFLKKAYGRVLPSGPWGGRGVAVQGLAMVTDAGGALPDGGWLKWSMHGT